MPDVNATKLDSMMQKVEALLSRADHPNTPPEEADTARQMAERIMAKYKIEQEDLIKRGELKVDQFNVLFKTVYAAPTESEYAMVYRDIAAYCIHHVGAVGVNKGIEYKDGVGYWIIEFIGYEEDIRYAEALFMHARLLFADRMEPKYDPALSDEDNVYRMRSAGMERIKIARIMGWEKGGAKVTRLYKKACEARGEEPVLTGQGTMVGDYKEAYKQGFLNRLWTNMSNARSAVEAELDSGGLVLHGRKDRILEAMYTRYPILRPDTTPVKTKQRPVKYRGPSKADMRKMERMSRGVAQAGRNAGASAANEVNIKGQTPKRRLEN